MPFQFDTVSGIRDDALWLAGEPIDGSSDYHDRALDYLNSVQAALVGGGPLGGAVLPIVDWLWLRRSGALVLVPKYESGVITAGFAAGSAQVLLSDDPGEDLIGYRLELDDGGAAPGVKPLVVGQGPMTLSYPWPGEDVTTTFTGVKERYALPDDFHRFVGTLRNQFSGAVLGLGPDPEMHSGLPSVATLLDDATLVVLGAPQSPTVYEFQYIADPSSLSDADEPAVPTAHRRILSYGAAYLILLDKRDDSSATLYQQFATEWDAMERDENRNYRVASSRWGMPRVSATRSVRRRF